MKHLFLDTNIILDFFIDRKPFSVEAAKILTLSERGEIHTYISTLTIANCYYLMRKDFTHKKVISSLEHLCQFVDVLDFTKSSVFNSFSSNFNDFEDALQNEIALTNNKIKTIITRNVTDFKHSTLEILTPKVFLSIFANKYNDN